MARTRAEREQEKKDLIASLSPDEREYYNSNEKGIEDIWEGAKSAVSRLRKANRNLLGLAKRRRRIEQELDKIKEARKNG